jgi:dimeric dUTPase (all-alpha-NTP-PPase superfamily)
MNLTKLFEMQKVLIDRIAYKESDRFDKTILALIVEVGECANEWRGFKYWSKNQLPVQPSETSKWVDGRCYVVTKNPLLEEYVDGTHFVLQLGIELKELGVLEELPLIHRTTIKEKTIAQQFKLVIRTALNVEMTFTFDTSLTRHSYLYLLDVYIGLGEMLGFSWEEIEQAYIAKNEVNHDRQNTGY